MKYHFKIHREKSGYWAESIELEGCQTQADNLEDLRHNMKEALNVFLDEPDHSKIIFPLPKAGLKGRNIVPVEVFPEVACAFLLRRTRLLSGYTQHEMKVLLEFKSVFSYQKLERARFSNPTLKSLLRIKRALPKFPLSLLLS
ncbi:MAG: type II toxin-antitoxin system HicB family antitoxin [Bacteriovoracaceae bacterium]